MNPQRSEFCNGAYGIPQSIEIDAVKRSMSNCPPNSSCQFVLVIAKDVAGLKRFITEIEHAIVVRREGFSVIWTPYR